MPESAVARPLVFVFSALLATLVASACRAAEAAPFDGRPWNVSSGNASVNFIQTSPIGAAPAKDLTEEAPPDAAWLQKMHAAGMVAFEDYIAWGAVERARGEWNWAQHDRMEKAMHAAGLKYVVYDWVHFPPAWLRDNAKGERTLMRCLAHGQETNYLSVFDPRTIEWYDHFYKALKDHFGDRIDDVYACILGPYGEGNYPLQVPSYINMGHCHEGWWAGDEYATRAFQAAMKSKYAGDVSALNGAWGTALKDFADVCPPAELSSEKFKPTPAAFPTPADKRRWLDFMLWYDAALIDFSERSVQTVLKYFPKEKVRLKPGGTSHGINPITYGTYSPGFAKMAAKYGVVLQPGDCDGAVFADKWLGTAYQFYGVRLGTEPASLLDKAGFVRRMFSDASAGASQLFTYEFESHIPEIQQYISLYTGHSGDTAVAVFCPTTFHRLGGDASPTVMAGDKLRDLCDYDVLDELLINDNAMITRGYKALVVVQADIVDQPVLDQIAAFTRAGGRVITLGKLPFRNLDGVPSPLATAATQITGMRPDNQWLRELATELKDLKGVDGALDGLWTCRRGKQVFVFNSTKEAKRATIDGVDVDIASHTIWVKPGQGPITGSTGR